MDLDVFQGDSERIVENEYLGTVQLPASAAGGKVEFRLDEECLLKVRVEEGGVMRDKPLSTREMPAALKKEMEALMAQKSQAGAKGEPGDGGGLLSSLRRILGR